MQKEIWKDIKGYEGCYQVSNLGKVKSMSRYMNNPTGGKSLLKERVLKGCLSGRGYHQVRLYKNGVQSAERIHQLVAVAFLNHVRDGHNLVVNHIDLNKLNNDVSNLEIVTNRENCNRKHIKSSSKYTGVSFCKIRYKWRAYLVIDGKQRFMGYYNDEYNAHLAHEKALRNI